MGALDDPSMNTNLHAAFKREIGRLRTGLASADLTDPAMCERLRRRYEFFSVTLHHHHEGEDTYLFGRVRSRATAAETAVLDDMHREHEQMLEVLNVLDSEFGKLGTASDTAMIDERFGQLLEILGRHCEHEETTGVPIVQKYITEADVKEFMAYNRSGETSSLVLPWVCDGAPESVVNQTWGVMPAPVRLIVRPMMTRKYRAFSDECGI